MHLDLLLPVTHDPVYRDDGAVRRVRRRREGRRAAEIDARGLQLRRLHVRQGASATVQGVDVVGIQRLQHVGATPGGGLRQLELQLAAGAVHHVAGHRLRQQVVLALQLEDCVVNGVERPQPVFAFGKHDRDQEQLGGQLERRDGLVDIGQRRADLQALLRQRLRELRALERDDARRGGTREKRA